MRIHREGHKIILWTILVALILQYYLIKYTSINSIIIFSLIFIIYGICAWVVYFFRDPFVEITIKPDSVVSPATGTVVAIEEVEENEYFNDKRIQISIFMSPFDVHVNRNPVSGIIQFFKHHQGEYLVAWHPKSSTKNERTTIVIQTKDGIQILFRQIAGFVARRICYYDMKDKEVTQGSECGFIKFGSRADVFLPLNSKINVQVGDKMKAGVSIIADLSL